MKYPLYMVAILALSFSATAMADAIYTARGTIPLPSQGTMQVFSDNTPSKKHQRFVDQGGNLKMVENDPPDSMQQNQIQPSQMQSGQSQPDMEQPGQGAPVQDQSGQSQPSQMKSGQGQLAPMQQGQPPGLMAPPAPGVMRPAQTQPSQMQPGIEQPARMQSGQPQPEQPR